MMDLVELAADYRGGVSKSEGDWRNIVQLQEDRGRETKRRKRAQRVATAGALTGASGVAAHVAGNEVMNPLKGTFHKVPGWVPKAAMGAGGALAVGGGAKALHHLNNERRLGDRIKERRKRLAGRGIYVGG